jgi:Uma2 family endonuclease
MATAPTTTPSSRGPTAADPSLMTAEQFAQRPDPGHPEELVGGKVVPMTRPNVRHGQVCWKAARLFGNFIEDHDLGHLVINDAGIITERNPDTLRGADISFFGYHRVPKGPLPPSYLDILPDLVVEVRSPTDRMSEVLAKVAEYLNAGVRIVVVLDPEDGTAQVFDAERPVRVLSGDAELTLPGVLDGFAVPVSRLFA